ncbi:MAG: carbohydrate kinase family protein [Lentisphaerae bacterium]|nr:carbohydrate kinase family protein [Lentisphaerota bacterium]
MKKLQFDVVVAGHVCMDITPEFVTADSGKIASVFVPGKLVNIGAAELSTGGSVSNTGLALTRLGVKTGLMGKIGNDLFGDGIRSIFKNHGATDALTVVEGERTSYSFIFALPGVDRIIMHNPGANDTFGANDINYEIVSHSKLFHFGYPPLMRKMFKNGGRELIRVFKIVKTGKVLTSLDMSLPDPNSESGKVDWLTVFRKLLPFVDIAPFSAEETMFVLNRARYDELSEEAGSNEPLAFYKMSDFTYLADTLLEMGVGIVLLKCGYRGLLLKTAGSKRFQDIKLLPESWHSKTIWKNVYAVKKIVSATGAGDSAIAGFLAGLLKGLSPEQSVSAAACTGAQNLSTLDALSGIKNWDETVLLMRTMQIVKESPDPSWQYCTKDKVWFLPVGVRH